MACLEAAPSIIPPSIDLRGNDSNPPPQAHHASQQQPRGQVATPAATAESPPTKKMRLTDQMPGLKTPSSLSVGPQLWACETDDVDNLKAPRSALDAREIIQHELSQSRYIRKHKSESLRSALETLKEALKTDRPQKPVSHLARTLPVDQWVIPPLEVVQWMLTSANAVDLLWSLPDGLPIVSRQSLVDMFLALDAEKQHRHHHPAFVVCVNSSVAYFLLESMTAREAVTGLENNMRNQITSYFATAQAALHFISPSHPPSLPTLQALVYGLVNAQEVGDASQSWRYTAAACAMCIELGLHQDDESLVSSTCAGSMAQARYCLFVCYVNDKALAMNLGLPPCLPDDHIYVDLRSIVGPTKPSLRQHLQNYYLELAIAQGGVAKLQLAKMKHYNMVDGVIAQTLDVLDNAWSMIENLPSLFSHELHGDGLEYEHRMAKFSYYAIRTVLCHLFSKYSSPRLRDKGGTLASARASMTELRDLRHLSSRANLNDYKLYSLAHCRTFAPTSLSAQELLNAIAIPSPAGADLSPAGAATSKRRQIDEIHQTPAKRARLSKANQARPHALLEGQTPALQHPKPKPRYASFFDAFVDPPQPCPGADSEHSLILEWLESVGSDRDTRCRSDSHLNPVDDKPPRRFTRSAPEMGSRRDADGFMAPMIPASTGSRSRSRSQAYADGRSDAPSDAPSDVTGSSSGPSARSLVENPNYRRINLAANHVSLRLPSEGLPDEIASLVDNMRQNRASPGPSLEHVRQDSDLAALQWMGAGESQVDEYCRNNIFPSTRTTETLRRSDRQPMTRRSVPSAGSAQKVSTPVPGMLYGYNPQNAFPQQQTQMLSMGAEMVATNEPAGLLYPFFVIEFKGDGGSMWVATNQCLGGSASCVHIAEKLNERLRQCETGMPCLISSAAFSIATNGTEARLYISWKHDKQEYRMANVDSFLLQDPEHYIKFRNYVRNIIGWGREERLEGIRKSLDTLLEAGQKRTSAAAKPRIPPSADTASIGSSGSNKSRKTACPKSRDSGSSQAQSSAAEAQYWEWDSTMKRWFHRNADGSLSWAEQGEQRPG
ncbi:hypothetical protein B0I35DRAFT_476442 [Stachybotrys elegans]|uniref:Xylanolytic transcriptional activator regulatory domain-containing protein n=1 Tax=Stachybotrys elegans TaxID=80388 RepID=A0A8K0SR55_9HYPO|nr:hypothetical protein B0I35DRAFT_476442 [Stachybotrys elegans]